jgi:hypothetical protein
MKIRNGTWPVNRPVNTFNLQVPSGPESRTQSMGICAGECPEPSVEGIGV